MSFIGKSWPDNMVQRMKELVGQGYSTGNIALVLSQEFQTEVTRSAASGRILRLRKSLGDDTLRPGFVVGRFGNGGKDWGGRGITPEQRRLATRKRWQRWEARNGGAVVSALKSARNRRNRKVESFVMMRNHIVCCENPVDLFSRTGCCWPLWGTDEVPHSEKLYCNNVNEMGSTYCPAHMRLRHEYVQGAFLPRPGQQVKFNNWSIKRKAA